MQRVRAQYFSTVALLFALPHGRTAQTSAGSRSTREEQSEVSTGGGGGGGEAVTLSPHGGGGGHGPEVTLTGPMQIASAHRAERASPTTRAAVAVPLRAAAAPPLLGCATTAAQTAAGSESARPSHAGGTGTGHDGGAMGGAGAQPAHEAAHCARTAESGSLHAVGFDATREAQSSTGRASGPMPAQPGGAGGGGASAQ